MKRRILKDTIVLFVIIAILTIQTNVTIYANNKVAFTISPIANASQGDEIEVVVNLANNTGIGGAEIVIEYDATQLEYVEGSLTTGFKTGEASSDIVKFYGGTIKISIAYNDECTYNGKIATFKFKVNAKQGSKVAVDVGVQTLVDLKYDNVESITSGASFRVLTEQGTDYIFGDSNSDGEIGVHDAVLMKQYLAGMTVDINLDASDVNVDDKVEVSDAVVLMRYLAGYDVQLGTAK